MGGSKVTEEGGGGGGGGESLLRICPFFGGMGRKKRVYRMAWKREEEWGPISKEGGLYRSNQQARSGNFTSKASSLYRERERWGKKEQHRGNISWDRLEGGGKESQIGGTEEGNRRSRPVWQGEREERNNQGSRERPKH